MNTPKRRLDVLVRCASGKHRVRLNPRRLLSSAQCPKCKSPVDPTRFRRLGALVGSVYRASGSTHAQRLMVWCVWGYLVVMMLVSWGLWRLGDVWGPMTLLLFGPRWVLLLPVLVLAVIVVFTKRLKLLVPLTGTGMLVIGPVMGFNMGYRTWLRGDLTGRPLRVVTFNAAGGSGLNTSLPWIIEETRADIIGFQECGSPLVNAINELPKIAWYSTVHDQLCVVSRYPITGARQLDRENIRFAGGSGLVIGYTVDLGDQQLHLVNLHLDTPREGLAPVREGNVSEGLDRLRSKSVVRDIESRQAREWAEAEAGAVVVMGDFNLPVESVIYTRHWGDMLNAFSYAGFGFGYTRYAGWIRARIDHVLAGAGVQVKRAFVGPDFGSDHRPMIADLVLLAVP